MPCDGVTVLNAVPIKVQKDLLATEKGVNAIQNWLKGRGLKTIIGNLPNGALQITFSYGGYIQIQGEKMTYAGVQESFIQEFKPVLQKLSGYLL